jgi:hypothetical protein
MGGPQVDADALTVAASVPDETVVHEKVLIPD